MYKLILSLSILLISAQVHAFADDNNQQVITLKDGSQIKGVLAGIDNGIYTIKTPVIGDVHVAASDVASINNGAAPSAATASTAPASPLDQQVAASQQQLLSNPQSVQVLQQMAQDPEIMQALQDPALVQAVTNHDYQAVQSNPKVQALMSNPKMQELIQKLAAQQQQQTTNSQ